MNKEKLIGSRKEPLLKHIENSTKRENENLVDRRLKLLEEIRRGEHKYVKENNDIIRWYQWQGI